MSRTAIESEIAQLSVVEGDIVRVELKPNIEIDVAKVDRNFALIQKLMAKHELTQTPFLIIFTPGGTANRAARERFGMKERSVIKSAEALVVKSLAHRLVARFHVNFFRPGHPTKIFDNELSAMAWLRSYSQSDLRASKQSSIAV